MSQCRKGMCSRWWRDLRARKVYRSSTSPLDFWKINQCQSCCNKTSLPESGGSCSLRGASSAHQCGWGHPPPSPAPASGAAGACPSTWQPRRCSLRVACLSRLPLFPPLPPHLQKAAVIIRCLIMDVKVFTIQTDDKTTSLHAGAVGTLM